MTSTTSVISIRNGSPFMMSGESINYARARRAGRRQRRQNLDFALIALVSRSSWKITATFVRST